jgi:hypothetical protein
MRLMPRKPKPQPDDPEQSKRFIDMAREVEADEGAAEPKAFERAFEKVVKPKSSQNAPRPKRRS